MDLQGCAIRADALFLPKGHRLQVPQEAAGRRPSLVSVGHRPDHGDSPLEHGSARWHMAHQPFGRAAGTAEGLRGHC